MPAHLPDLVKWTIEEHRLIEAADKVLVAVSGGADSVALLHLLQEAASTLAFTVEAAHLDHGLRPESGEDADFVRDLCRRRRIHLSEMRIDVRVEAARRRLGLEEAAREIRREFLKETARRRECRVIALGHHRGDQAETVLHRFLRGSGGRGLAGMEMGSGMFVRPLLRISRQQLRDYLQGRRIPWREDASNANPAFTRNRLRHELLPILSRFNPQIEGGLIRLGTQMAREEDYWRQEGGRILQAIAGKGGGGLRLDRSALLALHPALRARVLRLALEEIRGDLRGIAAVHLELLDELLNSPRPHAELHLPGAWAGRRYTELWLRQFPPPPADPFAVVLPGPGIFPLPGGDFVVSMQPCATGEDSRTVEFDPAAVSFPLSVRSFCPGDRLRLAGMAGTKKVKDILMEARVERRARCLVPIVEDGEILWVAGLRRCEGRRPEGGGPALRLHFQPLDGLCQPTNNL